MEKTTRDLRENAREQIKRVYNRAYDERFVTSGGGQHVLIEAGVLAVAEWARQEALREAAEVARTTPLTLDDIGFEAQVIAEAILELTEGGS